MEASETLNFEKALRELETLVQRLEEGKIGLEEAIKAYERGTFLRKFCEKKLNEAQLRIETVVVEGEGTFSLRPCSLEESE